MMQDGMLSQHSIYVLHLSPFHETVNLYFFVGRQLFMGNRSYYLSLQLEHGATAAPTSTSRPPDLMDLTTPLPADGALSAARSWSSSESSSEGDSDDDHVVIGDSLVLGVGCRRRERAVCARTWLWFPAAFLCVKFVF